jgi:hypothetical protein
MDLRALHEGAHAGGVLNAAVLRSLRVGELIEQSRRAATWDADRGDDLIAEVAALYHQAKALGGEPARKPWRYVADRLSSRGIQERVTYGQLKNWSRRAKNLGLLPTNKNKTRKENG